MIFLKSDGEKDMFRKLLEQINELKKLRESLFTKIEKVLCKEITPTQAAENEIRSRANHIVNEAQIEAQKNMINDTLYKRQEKIDREQASSFDIYEQKDNFRQRIYAASAKQKKNKEQAKEELNEKSL